MKLTCAILLVTSTYPALSQTKTPARHPVRPGAAAVAKPAAAAANPCGAESMPVISAEIPKAEGCPKTLFALRYIDTVVGTGDLAEPRKWYTVNYTGYFPDGNVFDTSVGKEPFPFPAGAGRVIPGWDHGFQGMRVGGKRRLFVPYQLAYGDFGRPPIPPKADLIFDVELLGISDAPPAPKPPPTPTAPAGDTVKPATSSAPVDGKPATITPPADPTKPTAVPPVTTPKP